MATSSWSTSSATSATSGMYYNRTLKLDELFGPKVMEEINKEINKKKKTKCEEEKEIVKPLSFDPKELDL